MFREGIKVTGQSSSLSGRAVKIFHGGQWGYGADPFVTIAPKFDLTSAS